MKITNLLVPTDFSSTSRAAFEEACVIAKERKARILLIHVNHTLVMAMPELPPLSPDVIELTMRTLTAELASLRAVALDRGVERVDTLLLIGSPWVLITEQARKDDIDLIVIGTHGRTGVKHVLLGSVAEKVVRHAPCSVLVVRERA